MKSQAEIKAERDLVQVAAKPAAAYLDMALTSLTAYSLFWLHSWQLRRTIEAIAILNWRLFPEKFAMVGYPEYPDAFRTNRSLLQMQPKYRNLLTGAAVTGFSLNERGMDTARELNGKLGVPTTDEGLTLGSPEASVPAAKSSTKLARSIEPEREIGKLRASKLFEKWRTGVMSDRDLIHVHAMLGIFDHTPTAVRRRVMKDLEKSATSIQDDEAKRFLQEVRQTFPRARLG
jgi:hypothetical protein